MVKLKHFDLVCVSSSSNFVFLQKRKDCGIVKIIHCTTKSQPSTFMHAFSTDSRKARIFKVVRTLIRVECPQHLFINAEINGNTTCVVPSSMVTVVGFPFDKLGLHAVFLTEIL